MAANGIFPAKTGESKETNYEAFRKGYEMGYSHGYVDGLERRQSDSRTPTEKWGETKLRSEIDAAAAELERIVRAR